MTKCETMFDATLFKSFASPCHISNSQSQKYPIKVANDLICKFSHSPKVFTSLWQLCASLFEFCESCVCGDPGLLDFRFALITITTSKISNVFCVSSFLALWSFILFRRSARLYIFFVRCRISSLSMMDTFPTLSWLNNTKVSLKWSSSFYRKALLCFENDNNFG